MADKPTTPPPAYFLSLSLENVRSFGEKQTIPFARADGRPAQWTIILGDNGVGKTTVLKALAGLRPDSFIAYGDESDLYVSYFFVNYVNKIPERSNAIRGLMEVAIQYNGAFLTGNDESYVIKSEIGFDASKKGKHKIQMGSAFRQVHIGLLCYGYGASRTVGNSTLAINSDSVDTCVSLFDDHADLLNPEEWFLQMEYSSLKQDEQAKKSLEQVRQVLLQVLPDVTDIRISSRGRQQYLELQTPYGWVRLLDMSLGYQTLVVWLTDFASKLIIRYPDSKNPLEEPAIILIDEIDLHLHPSWQRKLIGFLSEIFKNTQFIATAHSPLVVQAAGDVDANVVLLRREGDQTVVVTDVADVRGWRLDQILTSELFGLETARSPATERKLARRAELLTKAKRTAAEKKELAALTQELDAEPVGETPSEREVDAVLQELRQRLLNKDASSAAA
jgi:predicted ATP-binding protein involved in virulence